MYNSENSKPRSGFGQHAKYKCPYCEYEMNHTKRPFMVVCPSCGEVYNGDLLIEIKLEEDGNSDSNN